MIRRAIFDRPRLRPALGSITWGNRARFLGAAAMVLDPEDPIQRIMPGPIPVDDGGPFPCGPTGIMTGGPFSRPGWCNADGSPYLVAKPLPLVVPQTSAPSVVVTPTSGPIPSPAALAAATAGPAPSWFDQSMIDGVPNKYLVLGGVGLWVLFAGGKK